MQDLSETGDATLTVTIGENPPDRLDKALTREVPEEAALSRSRLMKMIAEGKVLRDGTAITDPKTKVSEGEVFDLVIGQAVEVDTLPENIPLEVIWEDADLIVVNKADGDLLPTARRAAADYQHALRMLRSPTVGWTPEVQTCSAQTGEGVIEIWRTVERFVAAVGANGMARRRAEHSRPGLAAPARGRAPAHPAEGGGSSANATALLVTSDDGAFGERGEG